MKRPLCLALLAVLAAACAHQPTRPDLLGAGAPEPGSICLGYPLHARYVFSSGRPDRELAFKNYYMAMLDVGGEKDYVDCLKKRWAVPLLHAEYRRGRGWLKDSRRYLAQSRRWITPDQRLSGVTEDFADKDPATTLHRIHLAFADGRVQTIEETFPKSEESKKMDAELRELDARVKQAAKEEDSIDQPTDETPAQRRQRLGLPPR